MSKASERFKAKHPKFAAKLAEKNACIARRKQYERMEAKCDNARPYKPASSDLSNALDRLGITIFALREECKAMVESKGAAYALQHMAGKILAYAEKAGMAGMKPLEEKWFKEILSAMHPMIAEAIRQNEDINGQARLDEIISGEK